MNTSDSLLKSHAFKLKGRLYTFTVLQLLTTEPILFEHQLDEVIAKAPLLFERAPVILDCSAVRENSLDLNVFCESMRKRQIVPVGIQGANPFLETVAQCQGLAILNASSAHDKLLLDTESESQLAASVDACKTKMQLTPLRSGQQLVSKQGDLVVASSVSRGAELLAEGNIHVYGTLRGRALAGISGDKQARIFCLSLDAELVSIAGFYRLSDAIEPITSPCQIYLQNDHIQIEPLC